jgi:hypothetical protein
MFEKLFNLMFVRSEVKKRSGSLPVCELVKSRGSMINEVSKTIENQTQLAVMTENAGFNKIDSRASAILVLA